MCSVRIVVDEIAWIVVVTAMDELGRRIARQRGAL
jgi:hypothetical protein